MIRGITQTIGLRYSRIAAVQQLRMFSAPSVAVKSTAESVIIREEKENTPIPESNDSSATNRVLPNYRGDFREQLCRTPYLGTSVKKLNFLAHLIKGLSAEDAILELMFAKKDDTKEILWAVQKGCQIARDVQGVNPKDLYVAYTMVNRGPYQKAVTIHGRGRAGRKRTPSAHMIIMLREKSFKVMAEKKAKEEKFARTPRPRADKHVTNPKIKFH